MSVQLFPPEILDLILDELGSATEDTQSRAALLACTLEFGWIGLRNFVSSKVMLTATTLSISSLFSGHYLTALHFESMTDFPLSLFSSCCHLESLALIKVLFAKIRLETLSGSLFPSLRRLSISGPFSDDEAPGIILTHAAPTLTTLILRDLPHNNAWFFPNFKSTVVIPVLESIQIDCLLCLYEYSAATFLSRFLEHSTPMLAQIQIRIIQSSALLGLIGSSEVA
ncbi:hypothetical protein BYT27DRAFT_7240269 [Phlegmacium glaucopus]|nr:hypothetical protein BYT27DRAFT_7240269 [Phlegmacium glaucopus]